MAVTWNQATFDSMYDIAFRDPAHPKYGTREGYTRDAMAHCRFPYTRTLDLYIERRDRLVSALDIGPLDSIAFVGSGFGFLAEVFRDVGYYTTLCVDASDYIQREWTEHADLNLDVSFRDVLDVPGVKADLSALLGLTGVKWVITESMLESFWDDELEPILDSCEDLLLPLTPTSNVVHLVQPPPGLHEVFNSKTMPQWKATRPTHTWVNVLNGEVA